MMKKAFTDVDELASLLISSYDTADSENKSAYFSGKTLLDRLITREKTGSNVFP